MKNSLTKIALKIAAKLDDPEWDEENATISSGKWTDEDEAARNILDDESGTEPREPDPAFLPNNALIEMYKKKKENASYDVEDFEEEIKERARMYKNGPFPDDAYYDLLYALKPELEFEEPIDFDDPKAVERYHTSRKDIEDFFKPVNKTIKPANKITNLMKIARKLQRKY